MKRYIVFVWFKEPFKIKSGVLERNGFAQLFDWDGANSAAREAMLEGPLPAYAEIIDITTLQIVNVIRITAGVA